MQFAYTLFLILAFIVHPAKANQQDIELETFNKLIGEGHYQQALRVASEAIEQGNSNAELSYLLAKIYQHGKFEIARDEQKAAFYFEQAILLGDFNAALEYGIALTNGNDFSQDCIVGTKYLYLAHDNGMIEASALLGSNYFHGHCVQQNFTLAKEFLVRPLKQESGIALTTMGVAYFYGEGFEVNLQKAFNYFVRAAKTGNCDGEYSLATMYDNGIFVNVDVAKAFDIFEKSHLGGCFQSTGGLANMYYLGRHVSLDYKKAFALYETASRTGDLESQSSMAMMLIDGLGVVADPKRGFDLLHQAAKRGNEESQRHLGIYYFDGQFVEQSYSKAAEYYQTSINNHFSRFALGYLYEFGLGVELNLEHAEALYMEAFQQGNLLSAKALALWYIQGKYYAKDHSAALNLLRQSNETQDDEIVALYAMLLACSIDSDIQNVNQALALISQQKKLRFNAHSYEVDLAEAVVLGAIGDFENAQVIISKIETIYMSEKHAQSHIRDWYAKERFISIKKEIESFQSCSW